MLYSTDRRAMRAPFFDAWKKHLNHQALIPLEQQLVKILTEHPEYHFIFENEKEHLEKDYPTNEGNPFLHFSLHQGLREQISTNRPVGIRAIYTKLCKKYGDAHVAEHQMMPLLFEALRESQALTPELAMERYLKKLHALIES